MNHLSSLAREYLNWIDLARSTEHDADTRRYLSAQRGLAHDALIAALGPDYAHPFDMERYCRVVLCPANVAGA